MHILIDIGNSTVVVAIAEQEGNIIHTWRFKTRKEETVSFFRYELKQGLRKYGVEPTDVESVTISSVVPEVDDDIAQAVNDLTGIVPHFFSINDAEGLISIDIESPTQHWRRRCASYFPRRYDYPWGKDFVECPEPARLATVVHHHRETPPFHREKHT